jgi:hypothetical protein
MGLPFMNERDEADLDTIVTGTRCNGSPKIRACVQAAWARLSERHGVCDALRLVGHAIEQSAEWGDDTPA